MAQRKELLELKFVLTNPSFYALMEDFKGIFSTESDQEYLFEIKGINAHLIHLILDYGMTPLEAIEFTNSKSETPLIKEIEPALIEVLESLIKNDLIQTKESESQIADLNNLELSPHFFNHKNVEFGTVSKVALATILGAVSEIAYPMNSSTSGCFSSFSSSFSSFSSIC